MNIGVKVMQVWTILLLLSIIFISCAGTRQESKSKYSDISYSAQDAEYYGVDGERNCFSHKDCEFSARKSGPLPPSGTYYRPVPRNTPPVQDPAVYDPADIFPQEYRYSGVSRNGFSWGRMTVDPDGHYSGWDSKGGYIRGQIQEQW